MKLRRVVTGHDKNGRAIVAIDELCCNVASRRSNHAGRVVWSTGEFPADNAGPAWRRACRGTACSRRPPRQGAIVARLNELEKWTRVARAAAIEPQ